MKDKNIPSQHADKSMARNLTSLPASLTIGTGLWMLASSYLPSAFDDTGFLVLFSIFRVSALLIIIFGLIYQIVTGFRASLDSLAFIRHMAVPAAIGVGLTVVLLFTEHAVAYLMFPYPLDDGEGFCLNQAMILASGGNLYPDIGSPPYIVSNYPPVFPLLLSLFAGSARSGFFAGRLISIVSTMVIIFCSYDITRRITGDRIPGILAGLMVAVSPVLFFWGALLRVDILACAFGVAGLWVGVTQKGYRIYFAIPLMVTAVFTRQSSVEAFLAVTLALLLWKNADQKSDRESITKAGWFFLSWNVLSIIIYVMLQMWSDGGFFLHTVTFTKTQFYLERVVANFLTISRSHAIILALSFMALPMALKTNERRIPALFFIFSFATALLSGKVGSDMNYFLNLVVASGILAGLFIHDLLELTADQTIRRYWLIPILLLIPGAMIQSGLIEGNRQNSFHPDKKAVGYGARVVEVLQSVTGPVLCEDEGFCLLAGKQVIFNPFIMSELAREGFWDQEPFLESIRNREYGKIMLRFYLDDPNHDDRPGAHGNAGWDRFTDEMELAMKENYELDSDAIDLYRTWDPWMRRRWFIYHPKVAEQGSEVTAID